MPLISQNLILSTEKVTHREIDKNVRRTEERLYFVYLYLFAHKMFSK